MSDYHPAGKPPKPRGPFRMWRLMEKRVPWYAVVVVFLAILLMGWLAAERYDQGIENLRITVEEARDAVFEKEREVLRLSEQVRLADTDQFIAREARSKYGYLFPGEIRFVVTNPEVLGLPPREEDALLSEPTQTPLLIEGFTPLQQPAAPLDSPGADTENVVINPPDTTVVELFVPPASSPAP